MRVLILVAFLFSVSLAALIPQRTNNGLNVDLSGLKEKLKNAQIELPPQMVADIQELLRNDPESTLTDLVKAGTISAIINEYADEIFANIRQLIYKLNLDPFPIPDITLDVLVYKLALSNGNLMQLSSIKRGGDLVVQYSSDTRKLVFNIPIAFNDLIFEYDYKIRVLLLPISGGVDGIVKEVIADMLLGFDFLTYHASLEGFQADAGNINLDFTGNGLIDWLVDAVAAVITTFFRGLIMTIVEQVIKIPSQKVVDIINAIVDQIFHPTTASPTTVEALMHNF